jgi:hypothetical protein
MCIFKTTPKTHQTDFEFLIQKLHRKPYTCFLEKVGFFTRNPTKLDLHFYDFSTILMNFRSFYRNPKTTFTDRPSEYFHEIMNRSLDYGKLPGIIEEEAM